MKTSQPLGESIGFALVLVLMTVGVILLMNLGFSRW